MLSLCQQCQVIRYICFFFGCHFLFRTNLCAGCEKNRIDHSEISEDSKWNYKDCTVLSNTDAYGVLNFPGSHSKSAKVAVIKNYFPLIIHF